MRISNIILLSALGLAGGCFLLPQSEDRPHRTTNTVAGGEPLDSEAKVSDAAAEPTCPTNLRVGVVPDRTIDSRKARPIKSYAKYKRTKWARGHTKPVRKAFHLPASEAVNRVVQLEAKNPDVLPAGFRTALLANPKDARLRLRVAECELEIAETRRRASYDAAVALLLGADRERAETIIEASTRYGTGSNTSTSCTGNDCPKGQVCDLGYKECMTDFALSVTYVSPIEAQIEDLLSRGLMSSYVERNGDRYNDSDKLFWWFNRRLHKCGKHRCIFVGYKSKLAVWDLRDGGSGRPLKRSDYTKAEWKLKLARDRCFDKTGSWTRSQCLFMCEHYRRGLECRLGCKQQCSH